MLGLVKVYLFALILHSSTTRRSSWFIVLRLPDGSRQIIRLPASPGDRQQPVTCRHCFHVQTSHVGRRMLVEPCGGSDCVSLVNSTAPMEEHSPTQDYNWTECGAVEHSDAKSRQVRVSTSIKNTLRPAEYPWLVRIESRSSDTSPTATLCAGTLIHPQWIVTAAHCMFDSTTHAFYPTDGIHLFMGHYHRLTLSDDEYITQPVLYIIQPEFRISRQSPAPVHDIALLKLSRPVPLSRSIGVACLPQPTDQLPDGTLAYTAGWGHASTDAMPTDEPRKARIRISPHSCRQLMINSSVHLCGRNERGNNICSGDSGAGLMVRAGVSSTANDTAWKWHLFGVASFGLDACSRRVNHENAFAMVATDVDWIRETIGKY